MRASFGSAGYEAESLYYGGDNIFAMNPEPTQVGAVMTSWSQSGGG
jgi:hypothetical protein